MNLHKIIISNDKFAIYIAIFSLCLSLFASSAAIKNTINQKEIDSLSAFSAVYLEQQQLLMRLRCIEKNFRIYCKILRRFGLLNHYYKKTLTSF